MRSKSTFLLIFSLLLINKASTGMEHSSGRLAACLEGSAIGQPFPQIAKDIICDYVGDQNSNKKKIVIFSSIGGGGHTSVATALSHYLEDDYVVIVSNIFSDVLSAWDTVQWISFGYCSGEKVYNYLMKHNQYSLINICFNMIGSFKCKIEEEKISKLIKSYCEQRKVDFIISVVPYVNQGIAKAAHSLQVPFLLIPTDTDFSGFIKHLKANTDNNFKLALPFNDSVDQKYLKESTISQDQTVVTGCVLKQDFFEPKDKTAIKKNFNIPLEKPVVLLLLGSIGSVQIPTFAKALSKITTPAHIIVCVSKQEKLKEEIDATCHPAHVSKTVIGFTDRIADLMGIADLLVTKSGSISVWEAMYSELPMIIDATAHPIAWEKENHELVKRNNFGTTLERLDDLPRVVSELFTDKTKLALMKANLMKFAKKDGGQEIRKVIEFQLARAQNKNKSAECQPRGVSDEEMVNFRKIAVVILVAGIIIIYFYQ